MKSNFFSSAIMKTSVISKEFRERYLSDPKKSNVFNGKAVVFEGPEDYHKRINDKKLKIDENSILIIRGCGPVGYPGSAEVVNMQPPDRLLKKGITCTYQLLEMEDKVVPQKAHQFFMFHQSLLLVVI